MAVTASSTTNIFLLSSFLFIVPWLYFTLTCRLKTPNVRDLQVQTGRRSRKLVAVFVALHTVYMLYNLIVSGSQNVFTLLHVPLNEPSDNIRLTLLRKAGVVALPRSLEVLLRTRLQSYDARIAYVRFGHSAIQDCEHCTTFNDFALYSLPRPVLEYVRMAAVIGLLTVEGTSRSGWRSWALACLTIAGVAELYFVLTTEISLASGQRETLMIHDTALLLRRIFFLLIPFLLYIAPVSRKPSSPLQILPELVARAERTRARLRLLRMTSAASSRHPNLRASGNAWWSAHRRDGQCVINDSAVREMAQNLGIELDSDVHSGDTKNLRGRARNVLNALQNGYRPDA